MHNRPNGHRSDDAPHVRGVAVLAAPGRPAARPPGVVSGPPAPRQPAGPAPQAEPDCRACGSPLDGRFCERCGHDSHSAEPLPAPSGRSPAPASWCVVAVADRDYFEAMRALNGPDASTVSFPQFCPQRRFPLRGDRALVGRRSPRRGIEPEIDLTGPPEDPGVSHSHALLLAQPDGTWAVVDLGSANGTYINDDRTAPITANRPIPIGDRDRIHIGAWTRLTLQANGGGSR